MTTTPTPAPALSSVLSTDEQWAVFHALAERYVPLRAHRDRVRAYEIGGVSHPDGGSWRPAIDSANKGMAVIESVVSKLPEYMRVEWAREVERVAS